MVGNTGKVVPARDPEGLSAALKELIDLGMEERGKIGEEARERIIQNFSLDSIVHRYEQLYEQVSEENRNN
jgi:glycosyltransferase involved in cell wall biosynthesis